MVKDLIWKLSIWRSKDALPTLPGPCSNAYEGSQYLLKILLGYAGGCEGAQAFKL